VLSPMLKTVGARAATIAVLGLAALVTPAASQDVAPVEPGPLPEPAIGADGTLALAGPVDEDLYVVGPGDRLTITVWGTAVRTFAAQVSPEGQLLVPGMAGVDVAGLTLARAKQLLLERLGDIYHDVEFSITLAGLRSVLVNVLGAVEVPGAYETAVMTPASEVIARAGGLSRGASRRNIRIERRGGATARVDLDMYENAGELDANPPILDGDVVFVPSATEFVHAEGGVARPGEYEFVVGEDVRSLIAVAGGLTRDAAPDSVELARFVDPTTTESAMIPMPVEGSVSVELSPGDQVYVRRRPDWKRVEWVRIDGEVRHPGTYGINEGVDRLSDVMSRAGGPTGRAYLPNASVVRAPTRGVRDLELQRLLEIPVGNMSEMEYAYYKMRLREQGRRVSVDLQALLSGEPEDDPLMVHGDVITLPERPFTVTVSGEVTRPGKIAYEPGRRYGHYVDAAEGYTEGARRNRVRVIRASTGQLLAARRAGTIEPGDEVWVPEKPESDWWQTVRDVLSFVTSLATVYLVIDQASTN